MAVTPSKSGLPVNRPGTHQNPTPTPRPTHAGTRRNLTGRKGRGGRGGKGGK